MARDTKNVTPYVKNKQMVICTADLHPDLTVEKEISNN
jgi:hypothetical protein